VNVQGQLAGLAGIITGGGSGIGRSLSEACVQAGARVAIFDWDFDTAQETAASIGESARAWAVDVRDEPAVAQATQEAYDYLGGLDFLVNNAGVRHHGSFLDHDVAEFRKTLDVDLTGVFVCSQAVARHMVRDGGGKVVNIASIAGTLALKNRPAYVAAKHGVIGLTRAMAFELGGQGIRCNAIAPGVVETPLTATYFDDPELAQLIRDNVPLGRWGQTDDLMGPTVFLCSRNADYVSGQVLHVDGGWTSGKGY
jgi:NAD(P)-dependent dehydrogenase (short-subunit alcohol dehydrogenase family)